MNLTNINLNKVQAKIAILAVLAITSLQATRIYQKSMMEFMADFPQASYLQCTKNYCSSYAPFPLYQELAQRFFPSRVKFDDVFILNIPNAKAYLDKSCYVFINNCFIKETQLKNLNFFYGKDFIEQDDTGDAVKIPGRVVVICNLYPSNYALWFFDVLSQLSLLDMHNIEYDYLCVPYFCEFMQESLDLFRIDRRKIIPLTVGMCIQADTIILPTSTSQENNHARCANYYIDFLLNHTRKKMLDSIENIDFKRDFPEKIFISRKDSSNRRSIPNEDEVFDFFKPLGFQRYELTKLSVAEKIALFHHAKTIVSFVGAGSTSILFCKPKTHYIEITQKMVEATYFFIADKLDIKYSSINDSTVADLLRGSPLSSSASLSLYCVKKFLKEHPEL